MKEFTEKDKRQEAFLRIANVLYSHWRVSNPREKETEQCGGHSRLFEVLIPDEYITVGQSINGKGHREHVVPCALIRGRSYKMFNDECSVENVAEMIEKNLKIVHITKDEQKILDVEKGWKTTMPAGWSFESGDPFARLLGANIEYNLY